jgi:DNA-binding winged helix-turn-helix (wHTH) protein
MRMATKPHAFRIATEAYPEALAQESSETNALRALTTFDNRLPCAQPLRLRIGEFEVDLRTGELRTAASTVRLQEQPFQILRMLLGHNGEIVTREQIQQTLWTEGIVVDFEHSINSAIKKLRQAFGDSADHPRYIETISRRGYRLMLPVQWSHPGQMAPLPEEETRRGGPSPQTVGYLRENRITKQRHLKAFDGGTSGAASASPCSSLQAANRPQEKGGKPVAAMMQRRQLEDRLLSLERLVLARVRSSRRRPRCLCSLQTTPRG